MPANSYVILMICFFAFIPLFLAEIARSKSLPTISDFFLQDRGLSVFPMYATVFATWMSAFAFMGAIAYFYEQGPIYMTTIGWDALFAVLFYVLGRRIWFYGKTFGYVTPTDFFDDIYQSKILNIIVTAITLVFTMIYVQVQMVGGLFLIRIATNDYMAWQVSALIFFVILIIYLWAGGLRAVTFADMFYGILIISGILLCGFFLMNKAGGIDNMFERVIADDISNVTLGGKNSMDRVGMWLSLFLVIPVGAFMGPQMWIRNYAAKSDRNFELLPFLLFLSSIVFIGTLFAGSAGIILNKTNIVGDQLVAMLILKYASPVFAAFIFISISAAILSTANSQVHAIAAIYTIDIHKKYINSKITEKNLLAVAKWAVLSISLISYILILIIPQRVFDLGVLSMGGMIQLIVPVLGALFWKKSTAAGAIAGLASGVSCFLLLIVFSVLNECYSAILGLVINTIIFLSIGFLSTNKNFVGEKIQAYKVLSEDYFKQR